LRIENSNKFKTYYGKPEYINKIYRTFNKKSAIKSNTDWWSNVPSTGWIPKNRKACNKYFEINLAQKIFFIGVDNPIIWDKNYSDPEDTMALHRFGWLLQLLANQTSSELASKGMEWISDWWIKNKNKKNELIWESYSISERIVNWSLFICSVKNSISSTVDLSFLEEALVLHIKLLICNLEYRKEKTNNHIINNARALYFVGHVLGIDLAKKIAEEILYNETDLLFTGGVLDEGSTHYQFLLTRTYLEIYWLANTNNDSSMKEWLKPKIEEMLNVCEQMTVNPINLDFPFIGDISPDYPPSWFKGYPYFSNNSNYQIYSPWSRLWGDGKNFIDKFRMESFTNPKSPDYDPFRNKWFKIQNKRFTIFGSIQSDKLKSHEHQDSGSFCFYANNNPIVIDPGLYSYQFSEYLSSNHLKANMHNTLMLNDIGLNPPRTSLMSRLSLRSNMKVERKNNEIKLFLRGFRSLGKWIDWDRTFIIKENELIIKDSINSLNYEKVKLKFIFMHNISINEAGHHYHGNNEEVEFIIKSNHLHKERRTHLFITDGTISERYGGKLPCHILNIDCFGKGPLEIETLLEFKKKRD